MEEVKEYIQLLFRNHDLDVDVYFPLILSLLDDSVGDDTEETVFDILWGTELPKGCIRNLCSEICETYKRMFLSGNQYEMLYEYYQHIDEKDDGDYCIDTKSSSSLDLWVHLLKDSSSSSSIDNCAEDLEQTDNCVEDGFVVVHGKNKRNNRKKGLMVKVTSSSDNCVEVNSPLSLSLKNRKKDENIDKLIESNYDFVESEKNENSEIIEVNGDHFNQPGKYLSQEYIDERQKALNLGKNRNKCFQRPIKAYKRGEKDLAKQLSVEGSEFDNAMKLSNQKAAELIFNYRNTKENLLNGVIDLHGLFVSEAKMYLITLLPVLKAKRTSKTIHIITGVGHHSKGKPKLLPQVLDLIKYDTQVSSLVQSEHTEELSGEAYKGGIMIKLRS